MENSEIINSFVYSGIKNNLTPKQLNDTGLTYNLPSGSDLNSILNQTTI